MPAPDEFSSDIAQLLAGSYDCVDRVVLKGYYRMAYASGGFLTWWNELYPGRVVRQQDLRRMAGDFSRRLHAYAKAHAIPVVYCPPGDKEKHAKAEARLPQDPNFQGLLRIQVAKAPARVWQIKQGRGGKVVLRRPDTWPLVNHYYFHIVDSAWGHLTIRMSGYPPFGVQISLNGHAWVGRAAPQQSISWVKEGNCFVAGSDWQGLEELAERLSRPEGLGQLATGVDRWIYSSCLCFGLRREEQARSQFRSQYSCYQLEFSRNLIFRSGPQLDAVYQGLVDRTGRLLDVPRLRTIFGRKHRPHADRAGGRRLEKQRDRSVHDLTVFKLPFGKLTAKRYDKGERVLRIELVVNNAEELRCGKGLERMPQMRARLQGMVVEFLGAVQAAHLSFLSGHQLDEWVAPRVEGHQRLAGVDLQKPRRRAVADAVVALAAAPEGFTAETLAQRVCQSGEKGLADYHGRKAAYDLRKLRGKGLGERIAKTRRYRVKRPGIRTLAGLLILRAKVIKPVLAGLPQPKRGRPPKNVHPLDGHYQNLQREMLATLRALQLAA